MARGARRYSTSPQSDPALAEPVRPQTGRGGGGRSAAGVKIIEHVQNANEFGRYEVMVGRIYNQAAFDAWWQIQRRRAAPIRGNGCAETAKKSLRYGGRVRLTAL